MPLPNTDVAVRGNEDDGDGDADMVAVAMSGDDFDLEDRHKNGNVEMPREEEDCSERIHDQLPSVETYKATADLQTTSTHKTGFCSSTRNRVMFGGLLIVALMVLCISLGVTIGRDEAAAEEARAIGGDDTDMMPPLEDVRRSRVDEVVQFVTDMGWSLAKDIEPVASAQYKAAEWIADYDPKYPKLENNEVLRSRYALVVFYFATRGDSWDYQLHWKTGKHVCEWNDEWATLSGKKTPVGVVCEPHTNNVTEIVLPSVGLEGKLPPEISLLTSLQVLDLYNNDLAGAIPETFQNLQSLTTFVLHRNAFEGLIPHWLSNLKALKTLDLANNDFDGFLPNTLVELNSLEILNLDNNKLKGPLKHLMHFKSLKLLSLGDNFFSEGLSDDLLLSWSSLTDLDLSENVLTGKLPEALFQDRKLVLADLHGNRFEGVLPKISGSSTCKIEFLALHENNFTGLIDNGWKHLTNLRHLDLSNNFLDGVLPTNISLLVDLKYLFLAFNPKLTAGPIPAEWSDLKSLVDFSLQRTNRNGKIPTLLSRLKNLALLDLANNEISGNVPTEIGELVELSFLILKGNKLAGEIPASLKHLSKLHTVVIDDNNFIAGAEHVCNANSSALDDFIVDCTINCTCCTKCCDASDKGCNNITWFSQVDPTASYEFTRFHYKFHEKDVVIPVPDSKTVTEQYETFGMIRDRAPDDDN